jgi:rhodanese-related sulfurtransferase
LDFTSIIQIILFALIAYFLFSRLAPVKGLKNISAQQFKDELDQRTPKYIMDVREPNEYKNGFIPGAVNVPLSQLSARINALPKDKPLYLYCQSGMRSKQAARVLAKRGYSNLINLQGGIMSWKGKIQK